MYSYVCVRSCMFYLCSILNAAIYTPKQTNGIQYGNYTGNCKRTEGKGKGAKGNRHFPKLFIRLPLNAFFLSCHRFCCCFAHDFCRRGACKTALLPQPSP